MKPWLILLPAVATIPAVGLMARADWSGDRVENALVASLPAASLDKLWVKVRQPVSIEDLSNELSVDETRLAKLNDVNEDHEFESGDWLVLPSQSSRKAKFLLALDTSELRRTPPLQQPPPLEQSGVVRLGDTLIKIAQRYGVTLQELLRLNPGLETARLVAGSQVRLAQSSPGRSRMVLGLKPVGSGGLSWPDQPDLGPERRFGGGNDASRTTWIWPAQGTFTSGFGWRWGRMHKGIDVANNVGTSIVAARSGRVSFAGWHDGGYGYLVELTHDDGSRSLYAHNSRLLVRVGEEVNQGTQISQMGSTGRSTGPHLHFEIHPPSRGAANPLQFLPPRA
ncbi:M23 family metallopeptidase [Synechococcus sp. CBW1006]|nr:M23 family metallopeptidase [Synechococcus sp. CBW1006]QPN66324.1 M23 family metallopeptidase [Synechococcus sp. CBW1006]